ncbi:MAG: phage holin family protein [Bacteroidales bacterium]|nr:phage holin family protein [Candidatus Sodaliphilus aphodohippi]
MDYKKLLLEAKEHFKLEMDYTKLTAVEKTSILLSRIALVGALAIVGGIVMFFISTALATVLAKATGSEFAANMIIAAILIVIAILIGFLRKPLIMDPITRFVTKLFLNPNDND